MRTSVPGIRLVDLNHKNQFCEVLMQLITWWFIVLLDRITQLVLKQKVTTNKPPSGPSAIALSF